MGHVFTPEEFASGKMPNRASFRQANHLVRLLLEQVLEQGHIRGAVINGSATTGSAKPGSDMDVVVVLSSLEAMDYLEAFKTKVRYDTFVPVEFVPEYEDLALRGHHRIDYFFNQYLAAQPASNVIGINPVTFFAEKLAWTNPRAERVEETYGKIRKITKRLIGAVRFDAEYCNALQQVLALPIVAALDRIRVDDGKNPIDSKGRMPSKAELVNMYSKRYGADSVLKEALERTIAYSKSLVKLPNNTSYVDILNSIREFAPSAITFARVTAEAMERG